MRRLWRHCPLRAPWGRAQGRVRAGEPWWLPERLFRRTRMTERRTTDGRMAASTLGSGMAANPVGGASLYGPQVLVAYDLELASIPQCSCVNVQVPDSLSLHTPVSCNP